MSDTIITYPYPPMVQMEDGSWYEMPDPVTLAKMVYGMKQELRSIKDLLSAIEANNSQDNARYRAEK